MKMPGKFFLKLSILFLVTFFLTHWSFAASPDENNSSDKESKSTTIDDVKKDVSRAFASLGRFSAEQRDQAAEAAKKDLEQLDQQIDKLEGKVNKKWDQLGDESRTKWRETLAALKKKRVEAAEWYGGVKRGSADAWNEIKKGYNKAFSELDKAWQNAKEDFSVEEDADKNNTI